MAFSSVVPLVFYFKINIMAKKEKEETVKKSYEEELSALRTMFNPAPSKEVYLSSGSFTLDLALDHPRGRGWRLGRQASLVAWWGSGKTTLALETIKQAQDVGHEYAYLDLEHSLDLVYISNLGIDWERFSERLFQPNSLEQAMELAKKLIAYGAKILVFDSVSGMLPEKMITSEAGSNTLGLQARVLGPEVVKLKNLAHANNCLLIYINQIREKVGVMYGTPETTQGGHAIPFFDDYRVEIRKTMEKENGEKEDATGVTSRFKLVKNKCAVPFKTGEYSIVFGKGIDKVKELVELASEYDIVYKHGSTIKIDKDTPEEVKMTVDEYYALLEDNDEFRSSLREKIIDKIQNQ